MTAKLQNPIRIVATPDEPYAFDCFDQYPKYCRRPGFEIEYIFTLISLMLRLPFEFVKVDTYEEVEAAMDDGRADITGTSLMLDEYYYHRWLHTPVYIWDGVAFIAKLQLENNYETFGMFDSFPFELWLLMGVVTFAVIVVAWSSDRIRAVRRQNLLTLTNHKIRSDGLLVLWFITLNVLLNFYANYLVVDLMVPFEVEAPPFDSVPSLGKKLLSKQCRLAILDIYANDTEFHSTFINPDEKVQRGWADVYRKAFVINPPIYTSSREETVRFVQNSSCVIGVDFATMDSYYSTRFCGIRFVSFPQELQLFEYVFYFTDSSLARNISAVMTTNPFTEFPNNLGRKYYVGSNPPVCIKARLSDSLPLQKFYGTFILWGGFVGVGVTVYLLQIFWFKALKRIGMLNPFMRKRWKRISTGQVAMRENKKSRTLSVITTNGIHLEHRNNR